MRSNYALAPLDDDTSHAKAVCCAESVGRLSLVCGNATYPFACQTERENSLFMVKDCNVALFRFAVKFDSGLDGTT